MIRFYSFVSFTCFCVCQTVWNLPSRENIRRLQTSMMTDRSIAVTNYSLALFFLTLLLSVYNRSNLFSKRERSTAFYLYLFLWNCLLSWWLNNFYIIKMDNQSSCKKTRRKPYLHICSLSLENNNNNNPFFSTQSQFNQCNFPVW